MINKMQKIDLVRQVLAETKPEKVEQYRLLAYETMVRFCSEKVHLRGLIEFSNICCNDCYYCGIRRSNRNVTRYTLDSKQILECAKRAVENGLGSIVLQSGERRDKKFIDEVCFLISEIKKQTRSERLPDGLRITLCVGEQSYNTYKKFFDAGAERYLLRIETSNPELFKQIHPPEVDFEKRKECLFFLKEIGFQVGTGVMIGLPNQTIDDLVADIQFFEEIDADMIGMGPYIIHPETPMARYYEWWEKNKDQIYLLSLKMIAATRLYLRDVNIASTTALQALNPRGREEGLKYGANVIMPSLTPLKNRKEYLLYQGKPITDAETGDGLLERIKNLGRQVGLFEYGDSKHYMRKIDKSE